MKKLFLLVIIFFLSSSGFSIAQNLCDGPEVLEIGMIKQEIETSLINARDVKIKMDSGEEIQAFYVADKLVKISVFGDNPYISAEMFFKDGFIRSVTDTRLSGNDFKSHYLYFKDNKLICYDNDREKIPSDSKEFSEAEEKWLKNTERYLQAVQ